MAGPKRHVQIDGDTRDGALFAESASRYIGTRRVANGRFEERVFADMREWQAKAEWREWRDETVKKESIHVERSRGAGMGAKHHSIDRPIAGNVSEGRLYSTGLKGHYVGERRTRDGKIEKRQFDMPMAEAKAEWCKWREELAPTRDTSEDGVMTIDVAKEPESHKEDEVPTKTQSAKTQPAKAKQESLYILNFRASRTQKNIAAFHDMDSALRMAESLSVALDVSGAEGEYDVSEVEVWG